MKFQPYMALAVVLLACSTLAAPRKLPTLQVGGDTFQDVTVLGFNATDLYFTHARGIANVKLKHLEEALQIEFSYNAEVAAQAEREQAESHARYTEALAETAAAEAERNSPAAHATRAWSEFGLIDPAGEQSPLHRPAPELTVEKWLGDKPNTKGRLTFVLFWASSSRASHAALPQLNAWRKALGEQIVFIALSAETERELSQAGDLLPDFFSGLDAGGKTATAFGATTLPCCVLIDPHGYVRYHGHPAALDEKKLAAILERMAG